MSRAERRIVVTGAGGFIGGLLVSRLLQDARFASAQVVLCDHALDAAIKDARVERVEGDLCDSAVRGRLLEPGAEIVFHLAGVLGGAAEADYDLARRVNIDASLAILETLRTFENPARLVFASSISVYGPEDRAAYDDDTPAQPALTYGAQKRMIEVALEQFSARGWIDGLALRLPGIVARPDADSQLKSAFLNQVFYAVAEGRDFAMPVGAQGTSWLISAQACVDALIHAALLPATRIGARRAFTLPAQRVRMNALVQTLHDRFPDSASTVSFQPDPALHAQFANQPLLLTPYGDGLGFRHDGDLATLVARAFEATTACASAPEMKERP